ncbi:MoxR family ATPase [Hazenella sp. IB182357]|uniref:MoxR family ATPase n=1 Tax=Polycladospora coralii TaxID=2771432 RepID=A0A926N9P6_9BACL|nr:MoxR family ATPase [Polycladospora coralii]MBD1371515.1 MoxR family ATPase [Polycladospora coralii]
MEFESISIKSQQVVEVLQRSIVGQKEQLKFLWIGLLTGGHILLEGVPGLGKTLMVRTLAKVVDCKSNRIQFTPDLMPSDVIGTKVYDMHSGHFSFRKGPIFSHVLIADEINRTPPKTQSALLEAMEEGQISIDGETHILEKPFFVVATQNPIEYEGTYSLPEAQLDRFAMKLLIDYPLEEEELFLYATHELGVSRETMVQALISPEELLDMRGCINQVTIEKSVVQYVMQIIRQTREHTQVSLGASPRAGVTLLTLAKAHAAISGRSFVTPDDIKEVVKPALRHRLFLHPDSELEGWNPDDVVEEVIQKTEVPR